MLEVELKIRTRTVSTFVITSRQFGGVVHSHHHARERASPGGRAAHHQPPIYIPLVTQAGHEQGKQVWVWVCESAAATTIANNSSRPPAHIHAQQAKQQAQAQQPRQSNQDLGNRRRKGTTTATSIDRPHSLYADGHIIAPAGQLHPQIPYTHRQTDGFVAGEELKMLAPRAAGPAGASSGLPAQLHVHVQPQFQQQQSAFEEAAREIKAATAGAANVSDSDGSYDSPAMERPRRRFVKPTVTTFETCFSRNASTNATKGGHGGGGGMGVGGGGGAGRRYNRRVGAQPRVGLASYSFINSSSTMSMAAAATAEAAQFSNNNDGTTAAKEGDQQMEGVKRAPAVSSLSSVLQELMHGRHRALSNFRDATAPQLNPRTFTVQQDHDGAFYVASSTGEKFAADSAIGKVFLQPAPEKQNASSSSFVITSPKSLASSHGYSGERASDDNVPDFSRSMRRSELDFGSRSSNRKWPSRRSRRDSDESRDSRSSSSSKGKLLGFSSIKSRLAAHRNSHRSSLSRGSVSRDRPMTLDDMAHDHHDVPAVLGGGEDEGPLSFHAAEEENVLPMLDPSLVDSRVRGDSSWEVPAAPLPVARGSATDGRSSTTSSAQPVVDKSKIVNRPIPYASGGGMALNDDDDDEDEDVNPLNRSFLNVRDIEFHPRTDKETSVSIPADALDGTCDADADDDDDDEEGEHGAYQQNHQHQNGGASQQDRATFDAGGSQPRTGSLSSVQDANTGRGSSFSSGAVVRVSSSSGNVSEFLGGFKGQLSTRRGSIGGGPDKGGFVNRTRSVRNSARKSAAALAANQAAALAAHALTRKLLDARSRIPPEFREDMPLPKKKKKSKKLRWDMTLYCREFEVESEDEEDVKPEIVKAPWEYRDSEERDSDSSDGW